MTPLVVRNGEDVRLPPYRDPDDRSKLVQAHTAVPVYSEMLLQVCRDYAGLGDFRRLTASEIRFFYDGIRGELKRATKPQG